MVGKKIIKLLNTEFTSINQAALLLGVFTVGSQILGLVRDRMLAGKIGPGPELDVYVAAFRVPDLLYATAASLISVTILIPFLREHLSQDEREGGRRHSRLFLDTVFSAFLFVILFVSVLIFVFMPKLAPLLTPGFSPEQLGQLVLNARIMLLSPIFFGISNLYGTITQAFHKFTVYALAPIMYNVGIILGIVLLYPLFGLEGLAGGVIIGALLHAMVQLPVVLKEGLFPKLVFRIDWHLIRDVVRVSVPRTLALAFYQIIFVVFVAFASSMAPGSISIFQFAYILQSVPFAVIGVSYSIAAFPKLVAFFQDGDYEKFTRAILAPARQIIFWSFPVIALFVVLRAQIVRVILGTGQFDWTDTRLTAAALALFALSVVAQSLIALLVRAYYAAGKTWRPLWVNFTSAVLSIAFAYVFIYVFETFDSVQIFLTRLFRVSDVLGTEVLMLPLAFTLGVLINFIVLWHLFRKEFIREPLHDLWVTFYQSFTASLVIGVVGYSVLILTDSFFNLDTFFGVLGHGLVAGVVGVASGLFLLVWVGNREISIVVEALRARFWNASVTGDVPPPQY